MKIVPWSLEQSAVPSLKFLQTQHIPFTNAELLILAGNTLISLLLSSNYEFFNFVHVQRYGLVAVTGLTAY